MKRNKLTYSQAAKRIIKKYDKRLGDGKYDKLASEAMNRELEQLAEQQENAKASMAENQYQEMAHGGILPKLDGLDEFYGYPSSPGFPQEVYNNITAPKFSYNLPQGRYLPGTNITPSNQTIVTAPPAKQNSPQKNSWWKDIPTESKVGAITQLAGTLGQGIIAATAGKPKPLKYNPTEMAPPTLITNDEQLAASKRAYKDAQGNLRYLSPSQYMASMSDLATKESASNAGIIEGTQNQNAEILNRDKVWRAENQRRNEEMRLSVDQMNEAARLGYVGNMGQTVSNIAGVASGFARDEGARKMQNSMMGFMSQANHGTRSVNGYPVATSKLGTLEYWKDPDGTPHWEDSGSPIDQKTFLNRVNEHYKRIQTT